jgi:hypothetical protein
VDGKRACTVPNLTATVLTPDVCGEFPTVVFSSGFTQIRVFKTGTCDIEFTDAAGVQRFSFDVRVQAP